MRLPKGLSIVDVPNLTVAKLYNTNIVMIRHEDNCITLNHGGWKTKHTKKCINLVLARYGLKVVQKNFEWFIIRHNTEVGLFHNDTWQGVA